MSRRRRERCATWFEVLVPRPCAARAVERLAGTGIVELDTADGATTRLDPSTIEPYLEAFERLKRTYRDYWPPAQLPDHREDRPVEDGLREALDRLQAWEAEAREPVGRIDAATRERAALDDLVAFLDALGDDESLDLATLGTNGEAAEARLYRLPPESPTPQAARGMLRLRLDAEQSSFILAVGPAEHLDGLEEELSAAGARRVALPDWLAGSAEEARQSVREHMGTLEQRIEHERARLTALNEQHGVAEALGEIARLDWMVEHLPSVQVGSSLACITGWTSAATSTALVEPLHAEGIPAVAGFPPAPEDHEPPRLMHNPFWARPFELFMRLMGTPGRFETDPSRLLAFVAPLLFGYMFGDVGQGAVLIAVGWLLHKRLPVLAMLIPGGAAAMLFGVLFGSVFALEGLFPALWLHPVEQPLPVLMVPLFAGAALILLGLLLNGLGAARRGQLGPWLWTDAGLIVAYVAALATPATTTWGLAGLVLGIGWYLVGCVRSWREGIGAVLGHMGELVERLLQLAVNTLSFLRVGAFALAHAGLSVAVVTLADSASALWVAALVLVVGNLLILVLEGLVVSIQTTRLILFEFFIRFFRAEGRPFQPMSPPLAH